MGSCFANTRKEDQDPLTASEKGRNSVYRQNSEAGFRRSMQAPGLRKSIKSRQSISGMNAEPVSTHVLAHIQPIEKSKNARDLLTIREALSKHFLLNTLNPEHHEILIKAMKYLEVPTDQWIILQGQVTEYFWIIASGRVEIIENERRIRVLIERDSVGEVALVSETARVSNVRTIENSKFWVLERKIFRAVLQAVNAAEYAQTKCFIESVPIFSVLTKMQRELLLSAVTLVQYTDGQRIVVEGDPGDLFFIIKEGSVECRRGETVLRNMTTGEYFGEQALLYNTTRTATVLSIGTVKCLAISREDLTRALGDQLSQVLSENSLLISLEKSRLLGSLSLEQRRAMVSRMEINSYEPATIAIKKGVSKSDAIFVILKGKLVESGGETYEVLSRLGEEEVIKNISTHYNEMITVGKVDLARLSRADFHAALGNSFEKATASNELLGALKKVSLFRGLSEVKLKVLIGSLVVQVFEPGRAIFSQGSIGDAFYIIKQGKVDVHIGSNLVRSINKLDYFGERALLFNEPRSASVIAHDSVSCWVLTKHAFLMIVDEHMRSLLQKRIKMQDSNVNLRDLVLVKRLGQGMLGDVFLTVSEKTKHLYALKCIDRSKISSDKVEESIVLERKVLMQLDHALILKLIKTFKDRKRVYFLLEYVHGLDLFDVIRDIGLLSDEDAKFYAGCLVIILEHLHERDIVYRDLKPENVMVDDEGYLKLIDFGTAKVVQGRTYTMIGTPHYMAPEVILGKGYTTSADYWSLGIMLFEFLCGGVPFGEEISDSYAVFETVLEGKLVFPAYGSVSNDCRKLIEKLLNRSPAMRCGGSFEALKTAAWLRNVDWDGLLEKKAPTPYVPVLPNLMLDVEKALNIGKKVEYSEDLETYETPKVFKKGTSWDAEF
jgi:cGMP-dependent protein kinase 1